MIIVSVLAAGLGFALGWLLRQRFGQKKLAQAAKIAQQIVENAKAESENLKKEKLLEVKDELFQMKQEMERELKIRQAEVQRLEKQLSDRELNLDRKVDILNKKEKDVAQLSQSLLTKESLLKKKELDLEQLIQEENQRLEKISGLTSEEARNIQLQNMLEMAKQEAAHEIYEIREQAKQTAIREAREIITQALQRCGINHVVETTVSVVKLPDDEMKGRIIGREGRNIRAFESATGIEVLIDDTPQTVVLSGFDPLRREIAKLSLEKLIYDGRIHPGRIEEVVEKTREELNTRITELGEQALHELGVHGVHSELARLLGKQNFRNSYGQNLLQHSQEVAQLAGIMASQLGLEVMLAKRAGILHDIGKVAEEYGDMPFHEIGVELAKKFGENEIVQNAIACQSQSHTINIISPISILVQVADAISVSRPGAQKETLDNYLKRMTKLESIAMSFTGVVKAYALQAGREIRVIVEYAVVDEVKAQILADDIAKKIREEIGYPGQVKVTVIREYRAIDYAK
jgi:ribonuclease Y